MDPVPLIHLVMPSCPTRRHQPETHRQSAQLMVSGELVVISVLCWELSPKVVKLNVHMHMHTQMSEHASIDNVVISYMWNSW